MITELSTFRGYCSKCKSSHEFSGVIETTDSGRQVARGACPMCDTKMQRILGSSHAQPA